MTSKEYLEKSTVSGSEVRAWIEAIVLPTYEVGEEEKNPIFLEKRVYQGSSGSVYPYPVIEKIYDEKKGKTYQAHFIENEYIKVMVLPELGGRIHMAYDKVKKRHFVYFNQVIKPALVGLLGPWISGGIEFNWPQHHRPSTFKPTDSCIEEHSDGSKTIWCSEVERMFRTKGTQGFRLYPGKAYIEIDVKVYNRTPFPQTFLWWANPAVVVHDHYHSVFPADVHAVFDHGKRDVSDFPIATGVYYKADYSEGVDISKYKNIPVPTSYMAIESKYNFVGGYEENVKGGLLHVANHYVSPGKKQWTWGHGDFGRAWDRNLTDEDGPYIELMTGVYTDNQPDFTWLQAYEEKSWKQYFMPYSEAGYVKNASKDVVIHLSKDGESNAHMVVYSTGILKNAKLTLIDKKENKVLVDTVFNTDPSSPFVLQQVTSAAIFDLEISIYNEKNTLLICYREEKPEIKSLPDAAKAAKEPKEIASIEQLYLTGLHLEQYRHATYMPADYYLEALSREEGDVRCNNAMGLLLLRKGRFTKAEPYFRKAIATLIERNPNPYDGEAYYNLACCLKLQNRCDEAYAAFYKAAWSDAWQAAAYFSLAQIDCCRGDFQLALEHIEKALIKNWHNHKARQLKASILRKLNLKEDADLWIKASLAIDPFNMGCRFEAFLLTREGEDLNELKRLMRKWDHAFIEYALDFANAGLYSEASLLLESIAGKDTCYPMVYYTLGYCNAMQGEKKAALSYYEKAEEQSPDYCFPNRVEEVVILKHAIENNPRGSKAPYYLGNFYYGARQHNKAILYWELSKELDDKFPTVWRNLSLAYYNKKNEKNEALNMIETAFKLDQSDGRVLMELDQLYKRLGYNYSDRLDFLKKHASLVEERDDLSIEYITLLNQLGRFEEAKEWMSVRKFHPWEGGEGKITGQYILTYTELAKRAMQKNNYKQALEFLLATVHFPENLGEGKLSTVDENDLHYYFGKIYEGLGETDKAEIFFTKATIGAEEPTQAFFYNDQQPDKIYYQGMAWRALGNEAKAKSRFYKLIKHGEKHLFDKVMIDYFAVSLPDLAIWEDDLQKRNAIHCNYVMGLGYLGLSKTLEAKEYLSKVLELDINHQGAQIHLAMC